MGLSLVTPPQVEPLTPYDVRELVPSLASVESDAVLEALISAARQMLDGPNGTLQRALITQTWDYSVDGFTNPWIGEIPLPPLQSIDGITYIDTSGNENFFSSGDFRVLPGEPARITPLFNTSWPDTDTLGGSVVIRFTAGYGDDGLDVPPNIRMAIAIQAGHLYSLAYRDLNISSETIGPMSWTYTLGRAGPDISNAVDALTRNFRVMTVPT